MSHEGAISPALPGIIAFLARLRLMQNAARLSVSSRFSIKLSVPEIVLSLKSEITSP